MQVDRFCRSKRTNELRKELEQSAIAQKVKFLKASSMLIKSIRIWKEFINWLITQNTIAVSNVDSQIE